jgi:hypothetical protein
VQLKRSDLDLVATPISDPVISRSLGIVTSRTRSLSPAAEALRQTCRDVLGRIASAADTPAAKIRWRSNPAG